MSTAMLTPPGSKVLKQQQLQQSKKQSTVLPSIVPYLEVDYVLPDAPHDAGVVMRMSSVIEFLESQADNRARLTRSWERHGHIPVHSEIDAILTAKVSDVVNSYQMLVSGSEGPPVKSKMKDAKVLSSKRLRQEAQRSFESKFDTLFLPPMSGFSHWLIFPMPQ